MKYSFILGTDLYILENYWFGDTSLVLFCNGSEIYRVKRDSKSIHVNYEFNIRALNQRLKILAIPNILSVDIKVIDEKEKIIPLKKLKLSIKDLFRRFTLSVDFPNKSLWSRAIFVLELGALIVAIWLIFQGSYIDGSILLILAIISSLKVSIK